MEKKTFHPESWNSRVNEICGEFYPSLRLAESEFVENGVDCAKACGDMFAQMCRQLAPFLIEEILVYPKIWSDSVVTRAERLSACLDEARAFVTSPDETSQARLADAVRKMDEYTAETKDWSAEIEARDKYMADQQRNNDRAAIEAARGTP